MLVHIESNCHVYYNSISRDYTVKHFGSLSHHLLYSLSWPEVRTELDYWFLADDLEREPQSASCYIL